MKPLAPHQAFRGLLLLFLAMPLAARADSLMLVANTPPESMTGDVFDHRYALQLIRGETKNWSGGVDARVALPSRESPSYDAVALGLFGTSGKSMQRLWFRLVFSGKVNAPTYFNDDEALLRYVRETPGAVGVIISDGDGLEGVRTASLPGPSPGT